MADRRLRTARGTPRSAYRLIPRSRDTEEPLIAAPSAMVSLLRLGDAGVQNRIARQLQGRVGNHAVQDLLQRDPPTPAPPLTDAQQWELDWNAHPDRRTISVEQTVQRARRVSGTTSSARSIRRTGSRG